ncbi:MAG: hypothetical protein Q9204_002197 [Flavoplaca sp. TL-2023a]
MEPPKTALSSAKEQALLNAPAGKPPAGTKSDLDDPANLDAVIIPVLTLCLVICTMSIIVRSYTKKFLIKSLALEDYLESFTARGSLFQFSRCVYGYRYIQRPIRLRDFGPPRGTDLEITIAVEEEDVDAGYFRDRLLV